MLQCASVGEKTRSAKEAFLEVIMVKKLNLNKVVVASIITLLSIICCLAFSACAPSSYTPNKKSSQLSKPDILENGVLRVGVDYGNPPLAGETTKSSGIDIDMASALADELGLDVQFSDVGLSPELALENNR